MNNIKLVNINRKDLVKVAPVYKEIFNKQGESWTNKSALKRLNQNYKKDTFWIAKDGNKIVGFCMTFIQTIEQYDELFIDSFGVLNKYKNRGIGKSLLEKAEQYARDENLDSLSLLANPEWDSLKWFEKNRSFKKSGWIELFKDLN